MTAGATTTSNKGTPHTKNIPTLHSSLLLYNFRASFLLPHNLRFSGQGMVLNTPLSNEGQTNTQSMAQHLQGTKPIHLIINLTNLDIIWLQS